MSEVNTKPLDCYLRGVKSPERSNPDSNIVGNLKRDSAVRRDDFPERIAPLSERVDRARR